MTSKATPKSGKSLRQKQQDSHDAKSAAGAASLETASASSSSEPSPSDDIDKLPLQTARKLAKQRLRQWFLFTDDANYLQVGIRTVNAGRAGTPERGAFLDYPLCRGDVTGVYPTWDRAMPLTSTDAKGDETVVTPDKPSEAKSEPASGGPDLPGALAAARQVLSKEAQAPGSGPDSRPAKDPLPDDSTSKGKRKSTGEIISQNRAKKAKTEAKHAQGQAMTQPALQRSPPKAVASKPKLQFAPASQALQGRTIAMYLDIAIATGSRLCMGLQVTNEDPLGPKLEILRELCRGFMVMQIDPYWVLKQKTIPDRLEVLHLLTFG